MESKQVQDRRHGLGVSRTGRRFLLIVISLSEKHLENLSKVANKCILWVTTTGEVRGVQAPMCQPLSSVREYKTRNGVTELYDDTKVTCFTKVRMLRRKLMFGSRS